MPAIDALTIRGEGVFKKNVCRKNAGYRGDVDGLRGLAVLGVVIFHLKSDWLTGGFVGVDVFFVISGFLISSIILRELDAGRFSLVSFYERRIRRICPALFAMLAAVSIAAYVWLLPADLRSFGDSLGHTIGLVSNWFFLQMKSDYFEAGSSQIPLIHTWSLAVEEQFYLIFPCLMLLLHRWLKSRRGWLVVIGGMLAISLAMAVYYVDHRPMKAFFLLHCRAWEFLVGVLVALIGPLNLKARWGNALGWLGLALIGGSMVIFTERMPFPGWLAVIPCAGAALILASGRDASLSSARVLSFRPLAGLGLISYSVYLWHWPLIAFAKYSIFYRDEFAPIIFLTSLILGGLSWKFIEQPFRRKKAFSPAKVFGGWAAASAILLTLGIVVFRPTGIPSRFSAEVLNYQSFKSDRDLRAGGGGDANEAPEEGLLHSTRHGDLTKPPEVAVWGDSHGTALLPVLAAAAAEHHVGLVKFGHGGICPIPGISRESRKQGGRYHDYSEQVLAHLVADDSIKTVILHARWSLYLMGPNENPNEVWELHSGDQLVPKAERAAYYAGQIQRTIDSLTDAGKTVVLVYPVPEIGYNVPDYLSKCAAAGRPVPETSRCADFHSRNDAVIAMLDASGKRAGDRVLRVRPYERLLHGELGTIRIGRQPLYRDDDHLSDPGTFYLKDLIEPLFVGW